MKPYSYLKNRRLKVVLLKLVSFGLLFFLGVSEDLKTVKGALSKSGAVYVLRWENSNHTAGLKVFESPQGAIEFAKHALNLHPGTNANFKDSLETIWVRREMGKQVMLWKTFGYEKVHRMTFSNDSHATLFETSFRGGAYSPSPIGHAIYLVQAKIH